jgi:hypothetical protein
MDVRVPVKSQKKNQIFLDKTPFLPVLSGPKITNDPLDLFSPFA